MSDAILMTGQVHYLRLSLCCWRFPYQLMKFKINKTHAQQLFRFVKKCRAKLISLHVSKEPRQLKAWSQTKRLIFDQASKWHQRRQELSSYWKFNHQGHGSLLNSWNEGFLKFRIWTHVPRHDLNTNLEGVCSCIHMIKQARQNDNLIRSFYPSANTHSWTYTWTLLSWSWFLQTKQFNYSFWETEIVWKKTIENILILCMYIKCIMHCA